MEQEFIYPSVMKTKLMTFSKIYLFKRKTKDCLKFSIYICKDFQTQNRFLAEETKCWNFFDEF